MLRLVQLSDLHIGAKPHAQAPEVDTRRQFLQTIAKIGEDSFDLLILSGDLVDNINDIDSYQWLREMLAPYSWRYVVLPGNHDRADILQQVFALPESHFREGMLFFRAELDDLTLFFLDTSSNTLPKQQIEWLRAETAACQPPCLLFMHHPPVLCGCRFMDDRYPLLNIEESWDKLREISVIEHIFCGHYHTAKSFSIDNKMIHLCPSTSIQIDPWTIDFAIQHTRPGWRVIDWDGQELATTVYHLV